MVAVFRWRGLWGWREHQLLSVKPLLHARQLSLWLWPDSHSSRARLFHSWVLGTQGRQVNFTQNKMGDLYCRRHYSCMVIFLQVCDQEPRHFLLVCPAESDCVADSDPHQVRWRGQRQGRDQAVAQQRSLRGSLPSPRRKSFWKEPIGGNQYPTGTTLINV